jgi:hypothetical protein
MSCKVPDTGKLVFFGPITYLFSDTFISPQIRRFIYYCRKTRPGQVSACPDVRAVPVEEHEH